MTAVGTRRWILVAGGLAVAVAAASLAAPAFRRSTSPFARLGQGVDDVELVSAGGQSTTWEQLKGRPRALFFGFTNCPVICPVTVYELTASLERIGPAGRDIRVSFVTVDPERDTPDRLRQFFSGFGPHVEAYTGEPAALERLQRSFDIVATRNDVEGGAYTFDHTATVFLLDRSGRVIDSVAYGAEPAVIDERLRSLAGR